MNDITFQLLEIVVSVVSALIAAYLIPFIKAKTEMVRSDDLYGMIDVAVKAAEQTVKGQGQGRVKKGEVVTFVTAWLNERKISITEEQLDKLIESAVYSMKQEG